MLFSTSGALPLPALALLSADFLKPGALPSLLVVWVCTVISFVSTLVMGRLTDRAFAMLGFLGMTGIAVAAYLVTDPAAARAIVTLLSAIPAIAAMASTPRVVAWSTTYAILLASLVSVAEATSFSAALVACGVGVTVIVLPVFMVAALRLSLERAVTRAAHLAEIDPLTGLLNRRGFYARTARILIDAAHAETEIGCALIDIDHFKSINDKRGHASGDAVLVDTVDVMNEMIPSGSLTARLGGEEFIILTMVDSVDEWTDIVERIRREVEKSTDVTISIGAVSAPVLIDRGSGDSTETIIDQLSTAADRMLYKAKSGGRNLVISESMPRCRLFVAQTRS
ncbi:GGDEF domain-containing protein [Rhodococcoides yunnanense]|uniref:GGDEF domain-containing protein n=1 Tax=Rhodococcoides yunnanense TaxID=278209 RepID=UPI0014760037|nr:GGDEF domain-containing protein [Rhodococcus yunnanensis]